MPAAWPARKVDILPQTIRLTLGLNDTLVLRNADDVPHIFGPTLIMPGQSFRLPFVDGLDLQLSCTRARERQAQRDRRAEPSAGLGTAALALAQPEERGVMRLQRRICRGIG